MLPGMDGLDMSAGHLKATLLPVIMVTAKAATRHRRCNLGASVAVLIAR